MTKEHITEIRKRCEDAVEVLGGVNAVLVDMFAVLDALKAKTKRAEALERAIYTCENGDTCYSCAFSRKGTLQEYRCKKCQGVKDGERGDWHFDEARFAAEASHD